MKFISERVYIKKINPASIGSRVFCAEENLSRSFTVFVVPLAFGLVMVIGFSGVKILAVRFGNQFLGRNEYYCRGYPTDAILNDERKRFLHSDPPFLVGKCILFFVICQYFRA